MQTQVGTQRALHRGKRIKAIIVFVGVLFGGLIYAQELHLDEKAGEITATAHATGHDFHAVPEHYQLDVVLEDGETPKLSALHFSFDFKDLKTGKKKRDTEMLHWLEYAGNPNLTYDMTESKVEDGRQVVKGNLSMHGQSKEVEIPLTFTREEGGVRCQGDFTITTTDFGLEKIRKMLMLTVDPEVKIHLDLKLAEKPAT